MARPSAAIQDADNTNALESAVRGLTDEVARFREELAALRARPPLVVGGATGKEESEEMTPEETAVFEALRTWRSGKARAEGVPPYIIAHDSVLRAIAAQRPTKADQLTGMRGFGPKKVEKWGDEVVAAVASVATA